MEAGANYADTLHRTVKQLHEDLPQEQATLEAEIEAKSKELNEQKASVENTQKHLAKLEVKTELTEKEIKRKEIYRKRLEKKQAEMVADMAALEARQTELAASLALEAEAVEEKSEAVRAEWQKAQEQTAAARQAKESYESCVSAIEAVLAEAENETLAYDPDTGQTTMQDPTPVRNAQPNLRTQIVKLAKRLAFVESKLFVRIFRLDEQIGRVRAFLSRTDIAPEVKQVAQDIVSDARGDELGLG